MVAKTSAQVHDDVRNDRLVQLKDALSAANRALIRASDEKDLLRQICQLIVRRAGFFFAAIGQADPATGAIKLMALAGHIPSNVLRELQISARDDVPEGLGPMGVALREGRTAISADFQRDPATRPWHELACQLGIRSCVAIPLWREGRVYGAIDVLATETDAFGAETVALLEEFAGDLSCALDKYAGDAKRVRGARALREIAAFSQRALASSHLDEVFESAARAVSEGLDVEFCKVLRLAADGQSLIAKAESGENEAWMDPEAVDATPGTQNRFVLEAREAVIVDDYPRETRFTFPKVLAGHGIRSGVNVRIGGTEGVYGLLGAYSRDVGRFAQDSIDFLQSIAIVLAAAIERKATAERTAYHAQFDVLTGLPNRSLFRDRLDVTLTQARRSNACVAVTVVDLDGFKAVNDTYGYGVGDKVLVAVAQRLRHSVRSGDTVGRLDGDKFAIVLSHLAKADDANLVVQHLADSIACPITVGDRIVHLSASHGIAIFPADGGDGDVLVENADTAMQRAREHGNCFQFYGEEFNTQASLRRAMERDLRQAIERKEFELYYQPEISLDSGRITGVEALLRWKHPVRGLLAAAEFIAVAVETGLFVPIEEWVIEEACAHAAEWHRRGHRDLFVAVNVSPLQIRRGNVAERIRGALARSGLDPRYLEIELTETQVLDGAESFIHALDAMKATGISIAVDDFGTGYSSLSFLRRFPIDKVKIDRTFIRDVVTDPDAAGIVRAIIDMAHHLRLQVTAEGIETEEQAGFLRRSHCDNVQGYLFGRPVAAAEMSVVLDGGGRAPPLGDTRGPSRVLLLVDDERNNLRALQRVLRRDGYDIKTATSAEKALEILANTRAAVIVSEQRMPGMSGAEFLSRAKKLYPDTVRIVLSGFTDLATLTAAVNEGAISKFLTKPWEDDALREEIRQAFHRHEQQAAGRVRNLPVSPPTGIPAPTP